MAAQSRTSAPLAPPCVLAVAFDRERPRRRAVLTGKLVTFARCRRSFAPGCRRFRGALQLTQQGHTLLLRKIPCFKLGCLTAGSMLYLRCLPRLQPVHLLCGNELVSAPKKVPALKAGVANVSTFSSCSKLTRNQRKNLRPEAKKRAARPCEAATLHPRAHRSVPRFV